LHFMPFPIVHLRAADIAARALHLSESDTALFFLGSLAPDGVHYREGLVGASQRDIGAEKKNTHLCPPGDELWGQVTDNGGWLGEIKRIIPPHDSFAAGYAAHVLTDVYNNLTLWKNLCENHPDEAAKAYGSNYYKELGALDLQLYQEPETEGILYLLSQAEARGFPGRVTAREAEAIRSSILHGGNAPYTGYINQPPADTSANRFVTFTQIKTFIEEAAAFALQHLPVL
jgi:hypothetical protein